MKNPASRTCDLCGNTYIMNHREIPRIFIRKRIDLNENQSIDLEADRDYCKNCVNHFISEFERKRKLVYKRKRESI